MLISNNPVSIKKVQKKDLVVTTSVESALLLVNKHRYNTIIYDTEDITPLLEEAARKDIKIVPLSDYLAGGNTVSKLTNTLKKTLLKSKNRKQVYKQSVISVWSVKGGVGRTTLTKTLALTVPKDLKVLVLDLNFQDGGSDLSYMLNLEAIPHVGMYLKSRTREAFEECLIEFRSNIYIMQAPPRLTLVESITPEDVKQMIEYGRTLFDFIIIDLPNENNALVRAALETSNKVLLLTNATPGEISRIRENCKDYDYILVVVNPVSRMWRTFTDLLNAPVIEVKDLDAQAEEILEEVV